MYLISLYFDEKTSEKIKQYISQVAKKSNNTYMLDANVPPHITISAFDTDNLNPVINVLEEIIPKISQGNLTFASIGFFFPYVIFLQPVLNEYLHNISEITYIGTKYEASPNIVVLVPPNNAIISLIKPALSVKLFTIPQITTVDIKCGKYVMVCVSFVNGLLFSSLIKSASIIGAGNPQISELTLIFNVLRRRRLK